MASLDITLKDTSVKEGRFTGTVVVSGEDFSGNDFRHEMLIEFTARTEFDIPAGPCTIHLSAWLATPDQVCVDGHLQCGPARQPTNGPLCVGL